MVEVCHGETTGLADRAPAYYGNWRLEGAVAVPQQNLHGVVGVVGQSQVELAIPVEVPGKDVFGTCSRHTLDDRCGAECAIARIQQHAEIAIAVADHHVEKASAP